MLKVLKFSNLEYYWIHLMICFALCTERVANLSERGKMYLNCPRFASKTKKIKKKENMNKYTATKQKLLKASQQKSTFGAG